MWPDLEPRQSRHNFVKFYVSEAKCLLLCNCQRLYTAGQIVPQRSLLGVSIRPLTPNTIPGLAQKAEAMLDRNTAGRREAYFSCSQSNNLVWNDEQMS